MHSNHSDISQPNPEHRPSEGGARAASLKHVLKYTSIFGSVQVLQLLISVVRGKFTAVLIGTGGMGLSDLYHRAAELVSNASNLGIAFSAVRRLADAISSERGVKQGQLNLIMTSGTPDDHGHHHHHPH